MANANRREHPESPHHNLMVTRRLVLQPLRPRHAPELYDAVDTSRPTLRRWLPFVDATRGVEDIFGFIRRTSRGSAHQVWGVWERRDAGSGRRPRTGLYCGTIGLHAVSLEQATATMGYWVHGSREGRGYATEAAAAALLWAFGPLGLERLSIQAAAGNHASQRVIAKLGFVREGLWREAQRIPGRRGRVDWVAFGMTRGDLRRARPRLVELCGETRPWEPSRQRTSTRRPIR
jgi:ribosomal-protein-serine acetyltransferase